MKASKLLLLLIIYTLGVFTFACDSPADLEVYAPDNNLCKIVNGELVVSVQNTGSETACCVTMTKIEFGSFGSINITTPVLDPGEIVQLHGAPLPRGCFNPDCGFKIILDIDNLVNEGTSGEENNERVGNCIG